MTQLRANIRTATKASQIGQPSVSFRNDDFAALIDSKGYQIIIEKAVRCPCEGGMGQALVSCQNCYGSGYIFINPLKTKAIASGINRDTKYKDWSLEKIGTISLTVRDDQNENLSFYDKITFVDKIGSFTEVLKVKQTADTEPQDFVFTSYNIDKVVDVFIFSADSQKLVKLTTAEYAVNANNSRVIDLTITTKPADFNGVVSVRYNHEIQYNVLDLPHEIRSSWQQNREGAYELISLPMNAIARRSHLIQNEQLHYDGTGYQDNSYLP
jgi:hypothetical protein